MRLLMRYPKTIGTAWLLFAALINFVAVEFWQWIGLPWLAAMLLNLIVFTFIGVQLGIFVSRRTREIHAATGVEPDLGGL